MMFLSEPQFSRQGWLRLLYEEIAGEYKMDKKTVGWQLLAVGLVLSLLLAACGATPSLANGSNSEEVITVTGVGRARGEPDMATLSVGVNVADEAIDSAVSESNETIAEITTVLESLGIDPADIQTTNFSIWGEEQWDPDTGQRREERLYRVDSTVQITVHQIDMLGEILSKVIDAGANNIYGLTFGIEDTSSLADQARAAALDHARAKAGNIAADLDLTLGEVVSVVDLSGGSPLPSFESAAYGLGGGGGEPPISEGAMVLAVTVQVSYQIDR
jgi:hypothetical protein